MGQGVPKRGHIKFRRRGNCTEENIQHTEHGESSQSRRLIKME